MGLGSPLCRSKPASRLLKEEHERKAIFLQSSKKSKSNFDQMDKDSKLITKTDKYINSLTICFFLLFYVGHRQTQSKNVTSSTSVIDSGAVLCQHHLFKCITSPCITAGSTQCQLRQKIKNRIQIKTADYFFHSSPESFDHFMQRHINSSLDKKKSIIHLSILPRNSYTCG